ncbi:MAG: hypothetical protein ACKOCN_10570, partial [Planctomycetaceae bacterium]
NRTPLLIAANTGFSAWIDGSGRLRDRGPRRSTGIIQAAAEADGRPSPDHRWGEGPAAGCMAAVAVVLLGGLLRAGPTRPGSGVVSKPVEG